MVKNTNFFERIARFLREGQLRARGIDTRSLSFQQLRERIAHGRFLKKAILSERACQTLILAPQSSLLL